MGSILFANSAASTALNAVGATDTTITIQVADAAKFVEPIGGNWIMGTLEDRTQTPVLQEVVKITGRASNVLTVVRAQEGTTAAAFNVGATVACRLTAGALSTIQSQLPSAAVAAVATATTLPRAAAVLGVAGPLINGFAFMTDAQVADVQARTVTLDVSAALTSALTAAFAVGGCVYLPAGTYMVSSAIVMSLSGSQRVTIRGAGQGATILYAPAAAGIFTFTFGSEGNCFDIADLSFDAGAEGSGTALSVTQTQPISEPPSSWLANVDFRGYDARAGNGYRDFWNTCVSISNQSYVNYMGCLFEGAATQSVAGSPVGQGVVLSCTNSPTLSNVVHNFIGCTFEFNATHVLYNDAVQGVTFTACNWVGGTNGIECAPTGGPTTVQVQLAVVGCQFNTQGNAIDVRGALSDLLVSSSVFFIANTSGGPAAIALVSGSRISIVGNSFVGAGVTFARGISVAGNSANNAGVIAGNVFQLLDIAVSLAAGTSGWNVQANAYAACTTNATNAAGAANSVGVASP